MLRLFQQLQRINDQRHFYSIRTAFIATMPIMLIGAYAVIVNQLPIPAYQDFMESVFGEQWRIFGGFIFNGTTAIVALLIIYGVCSNLATWYNSHKYTNVPPGICGFVGMASYFVVSLPVNAESIPFGMVGATGMFVAMVISVLTGELFIHLVSRNSSTRILADDPNLAVPQSFAAVWPTVIIVGGIALVRILMVWGGVEDGLSTIVYNLLRQPFLAAGDSIGTAQVFNLGSHVMWLFGIHGNNVLDDVAQTVFVPAMAANVEAVAAGLPAPNLVTKTLFDSFVYMGGSGTTLGLLIALLIFGKGRSFKTLFRFALPNSIFNINEPLIFGIPIVLNPLYAIPFVLTPVVMLTTTMISMSVGLVPFTTVDVSWATPVFISGYMSTGSWAGVVLQAVNLAIAVLIYAPFVRLSERMNQFRFERAYRDLVNVVANDYSPERRLVSRADEIGAVARNLANQMENAIPGGEMYMNYQPIVDARTNELHSVEALLRWKHPQYGIISPLIIVALAEETARINKLGLWLMEESIIQRAKWTAEGLLDFHVSVNVSTRQLDEPGFHSQVLALLLKHKVPAHQLQIEITETAALIENKATRINLAKLYEMGVTIAMDDFGVGHSSLLYLRTQPITTLKIDGSLSRDILKHPANLDIIATIYDLCNLLEVDTVIEFVDNQAQLDKLLSIGAFLIQGYYFSPALPGDGVPTFIENLAKRPVPQNLPEVHRRVTGPSVEKPPEEITIDDLPVD